MLKNYLMMALKVLRRRKFFAFASLFGISFTLVVLMVAAAVLDHIFVAAPPESKLDRMLYITRARMQGDDWVWESPPGYKFLDQHVRDLPHTEMVSFCTGANQVAAYKDGQKYDLHLKRTDGNYWKIFDFRFLEGMPFSEEDNHTGNRVAVISARTRLRLFGGGTAVGRDLTVDGQTFRIVGVVQDVSYLRPVPFSEAWVPTGAAKSQAYRDEIMGDFHAVILANTKKDRPAIQAELQARLPHVELPEPEHYDKYTAFANTLFEQVSADTFHNESGEPHAARLRASIALGALLFMLLPSLNLVNLNLSRTLERSSEIGVRRAFGARATTLMGQFLVENIVLTLIGGGIGLVLSAWVLRLLNDAQLAPYVNFGLNWRVFLWGMLLALVFGVVSGVYPAWKMSRLNPVEALRARSKL